MWAFTISELTFIKSLTEFENFYTARFIRLTQQEEPLQNTLNLLHGPSLPRKTADEENTHEIKNNILINKKRILIPSYMQLLTPFSLYKKENDNIFLDIEAHSPVGAIK